MKPPQGQSNDTLYDLRKTLMMALWPIALLAGPFRLLAYCPGTMGTRAVDACTWIGAFFTLPLCLAVWPPLDPQQMRNGYHLWCALLFLAAFHTLAAKISRKTRHSQEIGLPLLGHPRHGALVLAMPAAILAFATCGPGAGVFIALGWICNQIQLALIGARIQRYAQIAVDQRLEANTYTQALRHREA